MKTEKAEWLDIHKDREVLGRWIIANNLDCENMQFMGIRYDPSIDPPQLYDRMADWLKNQTTDFIDKTVLGIAYDVTFEDIADGCTPMETYTAAEFLFRPYGEKPTLQYVSDHFQEFQQFCKDKGLKEPPLSTTVYENISANIAGYRLSNTCPSYNATEGFPDPDVDYQYYIYYPNLDPKAREQELAHPTPLPRLSEANKTQYFYIKNDMYDRARGNLIDYYFLKDWAARHGSTQPECWAMNMMGNHLTELFIASHRKEWQAFLTQQQVKDLELSMRSIHYRNYMRHFEGVPHLCDTALELHQLLVRQPETMLFVPHNSPLLTQLETYCPIGDFSAESWKTIVPDIPDTLWENSTFQADALLHDPTVVTRIGSRLHPDNLVLLTAKSYPLLPDEMKKLPQLAPLAMQCVLKYPCYIEVIPQEMVTPEMVRMAAAQSLSAIANLSVSKLQEAQFTDAELTYLITHQTFDERQAESLIRQLPQSYPSQTVGNALAQLAEKHQLTYKPAKEATQQPKKQRGR